VREKTADELRRWRNPGLKAFKNFINVVRNKAVNKLTADDMLIFREWLSELILANMSGMGEASIRDAFMKCFNDDDENRTTSENRRMSKALILCGWERAGKFTSGDRRNQVMFVNPFPTEGGSEQDNHFDF
jgi:hypothetical protein